jgi:hypothetical protein
MAGGRRRDQTRGMIFPTVIEITPQLEAVTPDTFIKGLTAPAGSVLERAAGRAATAERERA